MVIRDTDNNGTGNHYGMVDASPTQDGTLTTVEGNIQATQAGADGGVARTSDGSMDRGGYKKFRYKGRGRSKDGFGAVIHDVHAQTRRDKARHVQGVKAQSGRHIRIVGRPSVCDFETHHYAEKAPKDPTLGPDEARMKERKLRHKRKNGRRNGRKGTNNRT